MCIRDLESPYRSHNYGYHRLRNTQAQSYDILPSDMILHTVLQAHLQWLEYSLVSFSNCTASIYLRHNQSPHFAPATYKREAFHTAAPSNRAHHSCDGIACSPCAGWNMVCTFSLSSSGAGIPSVQIHMATFMCNRAISCCGSCAVILIDQNRSGSNYLGISFSTCHQTDALRRSCSKAVPSPSHLQSEHPKPEVPSVLPVPHCSLRKAVYKDGKPSLSSASYDSLSLAADPSLELSYLVAPPRMAYYEKVSRQIYGIYLKYIAPEDIVVYSIDEMFIDATSYLSHYNMTAHDQKREEATECDAWSQEEVRKECRSERNQLSGRSNDEREKSADRRP